MIFQKENRQLVDISSAIFNFKKFDGKELNLYLKSGDWQGKAGACMVEGFCKNHIISQTGYSSTAMGLTVEKIKNFL
jgi:septum formation protein